MACKTDRYASVVMTSNNQKTNQVVCHNCGRRWTINLDPERLRFPTQWEIDHAVRLVPPEEREKQSENDRIKNCQMTNIQADDKIGLYCNENCSYEAKCFELLKKGKT